MTKIKLCGLSRPCDIEAANKWKPEYIGFVFAPKSKRFITHEKAAALKKQLVPGIQAVGVFVNAPLDEVSKLLNIGVIDIAQLHGDEDDSYIKALQDLVEKPIIKAFQIKNEQDIIKANASSAACILLDSGSGTGTVFDWHLIQSVQRPYFLAGGLDPENVAAAIRQLSPYAVDVSSGIEADGLKDQDKIAAFIAAVRKEEK